MCSPGVCHLHSSVYTALAPFFFPFAFFPQLFFSVYLIYLLPWQLTTLEQRTLLEISDPNDALQRLYLVWTLKEAYTKALGLGLGFDFKRIEVDVNGHKITVDNNVPCGWEFIVFILKAPSGAIYQVAAARQSTQASSALDGHVEFRGVVDTSSDSDLSKWFRHYYAAPFISSCTADK